MFGIFEDIKDEPVKTSGKPKLPSAISKVKEVSPSIRGEICPECGETLIVKKNSKTGALFVGCSSWPKCSNTMSVGHDLASGRGLRGLAELTNDVKVYFAENWKGLCGYRGMKNGDVGIIKQNKTSRDIKNLVYEDDEWVIVDLEGDALLLACDYFAEFEDEDEDDDDW